MVTDAQITLLRQKKMEAETQQAAAGLADPAGSGCGGLGRAAGA